MSKRYGIACVDIDVAMIVYNEVALIGDAVSALAKAGFDSFVILDMESDDGTVPLLESTLGDRVKIFRFPRSSLLKHGYAEARNVCAAFCQRRWVMFVDADEMLIGGVHNGFVEVDFADQAADLYSMERRNLSSITAESKVVGSLERHNRLYRPSPAIHWVGYIHEELHGNGRTLDSSHAKLVFDHYSAVKKVDDLEAKNGLYATMLMRGARDPDVRLGTNEWHYGVYVPAHLGLLRERAKDYAARQSLASIFDPDYLGDTCVREIMTSDGGANAADTSIALPDDVGKAIPNMHLNMNVLHLVETFSHRFEKYIDLMIDTAPLLFSDVKAIDPSDSIEPGWRQGFFSWLDALSLCAILRDRNPGQYVEIGSGNSTRFARWCIKQYGLRTKIISIDPQPRLAVSDIADTVYKMGVEDVPREIFLSLGESDLLFYDGSHEMGMKTDMAHVCFDIFPIVDKNVMLGFHDTYIPLLTQMCEDYFIAPLLMGGSLYNIDLPTHYLACVNSASRRRLMALISSPEASVAKELHHAIYSTHRSNISGDAQGCTFFFSRNIANALSTI